MTRGMLGGPAGLDPSRLIKRGPLLMSSTYGSEYMAFLRACRNQRKCPHGVAAKFNDQKQRQQLFQEWMYNGKDVQKLDILFRRVALYRKVPALSQCDVPTVGRSTHQLRHWCQMNPIRPASRNHTSSTMFCLVPRGFWGGVEIFA